MTILISQYPSLRRQARQGYTTLLATFVPIYQTKFISRTLIMTYVQWADLVFVNYNFFSVEKYTPLVLVPKSLKVTSHLGQNLLFGREDGLQKSYCECNDLLMR
jgi:hypothetical protein